jgi:hypothetical protein
MMQEIVAVSSNGDLMDLEMLSKDMQVCAGGCLKFFFVFFQC